MFVYVYSGRAVLTTKLTERQDMWSEPFIPLKCHHTPGVVHPHKLSVERLKMCVKPWSTEKARMVRANLERVRWRTMAPRAHQLNLQLVADLENAVASDTLVWTDGGRHCNSQCIYYFIYIILYILYIYIIYTIIYIYIYIMYIY